MTQTSGEKELILGNKQLISLFFVVVALCGVFFAMGYMVRGNALKGSVPVTEESTPANTDSLKRQQPEPPRETAESASATAPPTQAMDASPVITHPADDVSASDPRPAATDDAKSDSKTATLQWGQYIQVAALPRVNAEGTVRTLREQHLPGALEASSREGLFRVVVGPYHSTADVADAKMRLKALGFSDMTVLKREPPLP